VGSATFPVWRGTPYAPDGTALIDATGVKEISQGASSALVLSNVISFNVRVLKAYPDGTAEPDFLDLDATTPAAFDTSNNPGYRITALQITIRVWDLKTSQARQITIIQDM